MGNVFFRMGDIFEGGADVTVLPCSSKPSVSAATQRWIKLLQIPLPHKWPVPIGDISELVEFPGAKEFTRFVVFAASVYNKTSSVSVLESISEKLAAIANRDHSLRTIESPLLGTGAGRLPTELAGKALQRGFISASETGATLFIRVFDQERIDLLNKLLEGGPKSPNEMRANKSPKIFISHSSRDKGIAASLVRVLTTALEVEPREIRCTSVEGCRLPTGISTSSQLRNEIQAADLIIVIVTLSSIISSYVLFELGASWGLRKPTFPLLAKKAKFKDLPGPLQERNALSLAKATDISKMLEDARIQAGLKPRTGVGERLEHEIQALATVAAKTE